MDIQQLLRQLLADGADPAHILRSALEETDGLPERENLALEIFQALRENAGEDAPDESQLAAMEATVAHLEDLRAQRQQEAEAAERRTSADQLAQRAQPQPEPDNAPEAEQPLAEPETEQPAAEAPVAASGKLPLPTGGRDASRLAATPGSAWTITASADIRGITAGAQLPDMNALADAAMARMKPMLSLGPNVKQRAPIAQLALKRDDALIASAGSDEHIRAIVDYAADERRLPGGSLTAALGGTSLTASTPTPPPTGQGGDIWCSPSETVYDLCPDLTTPDGILDLPSITVSRGGIRYPQSPDFCAVYDVLGQGSWIWDPANPANDPKPCVEIPCPEWDECRLSPIGLCIKTDIMVNHAWPELVREWTSRLLAAQAHWVNAYVLAQMEAGSTAVSFSGTAPDPYQAGATQSVLGALEMQAIWLRDRNRMGESTTLEAVLPYWVRGVLRSDLAKRVGVDLLSVNNARLEAFLRDRGIVVHWVRDWHGISTCEGDDQGATPPTAWPTQVPILLYPSGTWVQARQDVIQLDTVYDSTNLADNKYIGLFAEEAICVINRCYQSLFITIDVCPDGSTSAPAAVTCPAI